MIRLGSIFLGVAWLVGCGEATPPIEATADADVTAVDMAVVLDATAPPDLSVAPLDATVPRPDLTADLHVPPPPDLTADFRPPPDLTADAQAAAGTLGNFTTVTGNDLNTRDTYSHDAGGFAVAVDSKGFAYVVGSYGFYSGSGDIPIATLLKIDLHGAIVWQRDFGVGSYSSRGRAVAIDRASDAIYALADEGGMTLAKYDTAGNAVWAIHDGLLRADAFPNLAVASDGTVVLAGYVDPQYEPHVRKYAADKTLLWDKKMALGLVAVVAALALSPTDEIVLASSGPFATGDAGSGRPLQLTKLAPDGALLWNQVEPLPAADRSVGIDVMAVDSTGQILVGGESYVGYYDQWLGAYDAAGQPLWSYTTAGNQNGRYDRVRGIAVGPGDRLLLSGTLYAQSSTGNWGQRPWFAELDHDGMVRWSETAPDKVVGTGRAIAGVVSGWAYATGERDSSPTSLWFTRVAW